MSRLFNVVVLGGAALASPSCSDDPDGGDDGGSDGAGAGSQAANTSGAGAGNAVGNGSSAGGNGSGAQGGTAAGTGGDGAAPGCSDPANAADPCGCPCCWADPSCPNTDEGCCSGWCSAGADGLGCCGQ